MESRVVSKSSNESRCLDVLMTSYNMCVTTKRNGKGETINSVTIGTPVITNQTLEHLKTCRNQREGRPRPDLPPCVTRDVRREIRCLCAQWFFYQSSRFSLSELLYCVTTKRCGWGDTIIRKSEIGGKAKARFLEEQDRKPTKRYNPETKLRRSHKLVRHIYFVLWVTTNGMAEQKMKL